MKKTTSKVLRSPIIECLDIMKQKKMGYKRPKYIFIFFFSIVSCYFVIFTPLTIFQICCRERCNANQMRRCYLTTFSDQFLQRLADFEPDFAFSFFFFCETVVSSLLLFRKVWPKLDPWFGFYFERSGTTQHVE